MHYSLSVLTGREFLTNKKNMDQPYQFIIFMCLALAILILCNEEKRT